MFVLIGHLAFNPDLVTQIWWAEGKKEVTISLLNRGLFGVPTLTFEEAAFDAFMDWWCHKADVYIVSVPEEKP